MKTINVIHIQEETRFKMGKLPWNVQDDHANIKKQIKEWEKQIDQVINYLRERDQQDLVEDLETISHEMMSVNL